MRDSPVTQVITTHEKGGLSPGADGKIEAWFQMTRVRLLRFNLHENAGSPVSPLLNTSQAGKRRRGAHWMAASHVRESRCTYPRVLLLDVCLPGWSAVRTELCEALGNSFTLSAVTARPGELLSIYTVRERHQCLLPLLEVRGNLVRLQRCLSELRSLPVEGLGSVRSRTLSLAILDALQQNKQLMQHNSSGTGVQSCFVEVTVMSTRLGHEIAFELDDGLQEADLTTLRRLLVHHISCDVEDTGSPITSPEPDPDQCSHVCHIEFSSTSGDVLSLESFFKSWLLRRNGEREEVHLILPEEGSELRVICDVHRPLLDPGLLFTPGDQTCATRPVHTPNVGVAQSLRVIRALSSQGVCGSMLYGLPSILTPTACWELDWDQLEANQENFHALCHCLQDALRCLAVDSVYNPLQVTCNLYRHLQVTLSRSPVPGRHTSILPGHSRQVPSGRGKARATIAPLPLVTPILRKRSPVTDDSGPSKMRFLRCDEE
ncbi:meiosis 1 arrest protein isoform X2 [Pseudophryne corroboree]|uniref:meiosis 1 arrest protein isoform X2 n=1 Tax=Pseudophryne corroboree TaxID=495146 RepID=UPI0030820B8F